MVKKLLRAVFALCDTVKNLDKRVKYIEGNRVSGEAVRHDNIWENLDRTALALRGKEQITPDLGSDHIILTEQPQLLKEVMQTSREVVVEVLRERLRQMDKEGWSIERDDKVHANAQLARAAACYALPEDDPVFPGGEQERVWPWADSYDKRGKHGVRRCLVIAAALLVAEIERLDRKNAP